MGSSISKVFKRKGQTAECPVDGYEYHTQVKLDGTEVPTAVVEHGQTILDDNEDIFDHEIEYIERTFVHDDAFEDGVYQNDVYYDDEDMIQFVSALSLAEFNQSALTELDPSSSKPEPKKSHRLPDALEEFFTSLDAQATGTAGPSTYQTATYGKTPIAKNLISKPVVPEDDVLVDLSPTQECVICVEEKPLTDFPLVTEACQHPSQTCIVCVQNWLARELDSTDWDKIHCVACKEAVPYDDMKRILAPAAFEKYDQYSRNSLLSTLPEFRWCISPTCKSGQIHENGIDGPIFFCTSCFSKACVIHNVPWHEGETCNEYDYRQDPSKKLAEEKASRVEIKGSSKPCPGPNCKVNITRNGGCDHMTCTRCKYEFCWLCLANYDKIRKNGNSMHKKSCKLHTDNLPD